MASNPQTPNSASDGSNDKLLAALTYPIPLVGIVILVSDSMKNNPFLRTHAIQSLALGVVLFVLSIILSFTVILACIAPIIWLAITIYYGYQAYQGKDVKIPVVTDFCRNQKWI